MNINNQQDFILKETSTHLLFAIIVTLLYIVTSKKKYIYIYISQKME